MVTGWYEEWGRKCGQADVVIVFDELEYRARFSDALKLEAAAILELAKQGRTKIYVYDYSRTQQGAAAHSASDILINLQRGADAWATSRAGKISFLRK